VTKYFFLLYKTGVLHTISLKSEV